MSNEKIKLDAKAKFNALSNAEHIFSFKETGTAFRILELVKSEENTKAIVMTEDGEIKGLFTDAVSAGQALQEVVTVFGDDCPLITVNIKTTSKGASVYYVEVK